MKIISKILPWILIIIFGAFLLLQSMAHGGGWDLYEHIAMADRWGDGFGYSGGFSDNFKPSTPYLPGLTFLALFIEFFTAQHQDIILMLLAIITVFSFYIFSSYVYEILGGKNTKVNFIAFCVVLSVFFLRDWLSYAIEFKPDTISLCFFLLAPILLSTPQKKFHHYLGILLSLSIAFLFKQQVIAPMFGLSLAILINQDCFKKKLFYAGIFLCSFIPIGIIFLCIENSFFYTILCHMGRESIPMLAGKHQVVFYLKIIFSLSLLCFFLKEKLKLLWEKLFQYNIFSFPAFFWLLAGVLGSRNQGGNIGNSAVGFILFFPFVGILFDHVKKHVWVLFIFSGILLTSYTILRKDYIKIYQQRTSLNQEIAGELKKHGAISILEMDSSYLATRSREVKNRFSIDTWQHIRLGKEKVNAPQNEEILLHDLNPDAVVCAEGCNVFSSNFSAMLEKNGYTPRELPSARIDDPVIYFK